MDQQAIQENNYMLNDLTTKREEYFAGKVVKHWNEGEYTFYFECDNEVVLKTEVHSDRIIRFRFSTDGYFENDFSYAIDKNFKGTVEEFDFVEKPDHFRITTGRVICTISKDGLLVRILDRSGNVLCEDEKGFHWEENREWGGNIVIQSKKIQSGEHFYGLGDKSCNMDLRTKRFQLWGSDTYGYDDKSDPLYKNIPFYIGLHHGMSYGVFFDNSFRSFFDFGHERSNVSSFFAQGGEMNYYFIYGPEQMEVVKQYTTLTGVPEMPPLWALGYHQCKWSYYPEKKVKEITKGFRDNTIPCDAIYLDIDYMEGFRCFTWSKEYFPDPKKMVADLKKDGFKTVVIIDPGIKIDKKYSVYSEGYDNDYFCRRADGPLMKGSVWPGLCNFPDFTKPVVRDWWADLFDGLIKDVGVAGVWNDMNEPAVFEEGTFPLDVRHDYDGNPCSHRKGHNVYGMQMARATYHGVKKFAAPNRPFVITRSGYAGVQRYTSGWTGDNVASWEHLKIANVQCQRLSISGMSFIGSDIGGFIETPDGELYIRWLQLAIFHPFCRTHSSGDHGDQEPWSFGDEFTDMARKAIELRYQLLPYIYTAFWQYVNESAPMLRPIALLDQRDLETYYRQDEFGLGDHILACPITQPQVDGRWLYLPKGDWYYWWNDELNEGGMEVWADAAMDVIPMYIKAGAVIPFNPIMQYVGEKKVEELTLHVYHKNGSETSKLYEDAGDGYGESTIKTFEVVGSEEKLVLTQSSIGDFIPEYHSYTVVMHGIAVNKAIVDGQEVKFKKNETTFTITGVNKDFKSIEIVS